MSKVKAKKIASLFSSYGLWSADRGDRTVGNHSYAIRMQAEIILKLVSLGIPHHLEDWAGDVLKDSQYADAKYTYVAR
tara:strand:+ start:399 stop:632 length:234 start_codon:yes stop_codon:yes gene_type:complete